MAHNNRSGKGRCRNPKPAEIRRMREKHNLTQDGATTLVCSSLRSWQQWEADEGTPDHRKMHPATWHLFLIRVGEEPPN